MLRPHIRTGAVMGRPRKDGRKDLPQYLYPRKLKSGAIGYESRFPKRAPIYHGMDKASAVRLHNACWERIADEILNERAEKKISRLRAATSAAGSMQSVCRDYRQHHLPDARGRTGKPLSEKSRADYARVCLKAEAHEGFAVAIEDVKPSTVRGFLSQWLSSPHYYNYCLSVLSCVYKYAIELGKIESNPCSNIERRKFQKRKVYIPDDHYIAITGNMAEWEAKACDLLYAVQARPADGLLLSESHLVGGEIRYRASKNGREIHLTPNRFTLDLLDWFRQWKKSQGIAAPHFVVYPTTSRRRCIGKPISVAYLSRVFAAAVVAAGFEPGTYTLRDLRKKSETDERRLTGMPSGKLGDTPEMDDHYFCDTPPARARIGVGVFRK